MKHACDIENVIIAVMLFAAEEYITV